MFILKISHDSDLRRIALPTLPSFEILSGMVQNMFAFEGEPTAIYYIDDEGDEIVLKTDLELNEAFRLCSQEEPVVLRLYARGTVMEEMQVPSNDAMPEVIAPQSSDTVESQVILLNMQMQFERVISVIKEFFGEDVKQHFTECKGMFDSVVRSCDEQLKVASGKCQEQFQTIKTLVSDLQSFNFEEQIQKLKDEFMRITAQLRARLLLNSPYPGSATTTTTTSDVPQTQVSSDASPPIVVSTDDFEVAPIYPSLSASSFENLSSESADVLPHDAAFRDLSVLEGMGFLNRKKNIELLAKHKGDVVSVVEELLADEQ